MNKAIYAGSFDPFSAGHYDILWRALQIFDEVHLVIASNPKKTYMFPVPVRIAIIEYALGALPDEIRERIVIHNTDDYVYKYAVDQGIRKFVRGIRNGLDLDYEIAIQDFNYRVAEIDTVYFTPINYVRVSSSGIREFIKSGQIDIACQDMPPVFDTYAGRNYLYKMVQKGLE